MLDTPSCVFADLCRMVAGRHLNTCTKGPKTRWDMACPGQTLFLSPARPSPAPGSPLKVDQMCTVSACLPVFLPPTPNLPTGAFCFQGHLWPPLLRCVRAWGLRNHCLAQIQIHFLSLCNNLFLAEPGLSQGLRRRQRPPPPGSPPPSPAAVTIALPVSVQLLWRE